MTQVGLTGSGTLKDHAELIFSIPSHPHTCPAGSARPGPPLLFTSHPGCAGDLLPAPAAPGAVHLRRCSAVQPFRCDELHELPTPGLAFLPPLQIVPHCTHLLPSVHEVKGQNGIPHPTQTPPSPVL